MQLAQDGLISPHPCTHSIDEKIRKLDAELVKHRENIKRTRPGPAQEAAKRRALTVLKQKKLYESQRDQLYNQQYNIEQTSFAIQSMQDSVHTVQAMAVRRVVARGVMTWRGAASGVGQKLGTPSFYLWPQGHTSRIQLPWRVVQPPHKPLHGQAAGKELKQTMKHKDLRIENIESMQDSMQDLLVRRRGLHARWRGGYGAPCIFVMRHPSPAVACCAGGTPLPVSAQVHHSPTVPGHATRDHGGTGRQLRDPG